MTTEITRLTPDELAAMGELQEKRERVVAGAVDRGIADVLARGPGSLEPTYTEPTPLERYAIGCMGDRFIDVIEDSPLKAELTDEIVTEIVAGFIRGIVEDPLLPKLLAAFHVESVMADGYTLTDGVVGQAIDQAMTVLMPYAKKESGYWYASVVEGK